MEYNKLFLILKKDSNGKNIPIQAFIEKNFDRAKLYFQGYIWGDVRTFDYILKQIGTFKEGKLITNNIFITGGFEMTAKTNFEHKSINQLKIKYDFCRNEAKNNEEQVKEIFEGVEVKNEE